MKLLARIEGEKLGVTVERQGSGYLLTIGDRSLHCDLVHAGLFVRSLRWEDGRQDAVTVHRDGESYQVRIGGNSIAVTMVDPLAGKRHAHAATDSVGGGTVQAPMPGRVVKVLVAQGDTVVKGAPLLILEAMKMENEITAPSDGAVTRISVQAGETVESGAELIVIGAA